ncbi:MAG: hypothetical protein WD038_11870 [Balneolales bacterium]
MLRQRIVNALVDQFDRTLDQCFILGVVRASGIDHAAVVQGQVFERFIDDGGVFMAFGHGRLHVIAYDSPGDACHPPQTSINAIHQVFPLLGLTGLDIGILAGWQKGHKNLRRVKLTGLAVHVAERLAGKVHKQLFPGGVQQNAAGPGLPGPLVKVMHKLRIAVSIGVASQIAAPQGLQSASGLLKFFFEGGEVMGQLLVTLQVLVVGLVKQLRQLCLAELFEPFIGKLVGVKHPNVGVDRVAADAEGLGNLTVAHPFSFKLNELS